MAFNLMHTPKVAVNASTQLYGIFGNPVNHSLSPLLHNALFDQFKMNAVYMAFQIEKESLGLAFEAMRSLGIRGVNITIPHKEAALGFVDEVPEDLDRCVGAVNTVVNRKGKLIGYNTDGAGFLSSLKDDLGFNPEGKTCLVLGAGGAARGVVFALARAKADRILIYNRTQARAEGLKDYLFSYFPEVEIEALGSLDGLKNEKVDLVVNATSCGMSPNDPVSMDLTILKTKARVYDLVYSPAETPLLTKAKSLGLPCVNGLGMLAAQAALSFELWTGHREGVKEKMLETLKTCHL